MMFTMQQGIELVRETLVLAEATADEAFKQKTDIAGLSAMFLARASQSFYSVGVLSERGLIGDAMSAGRTVVEMSIDYAYIAMKPAERIPKFESYDHVAKFKLAKAIDKLHGGTVPAATMRILEQRSDTARLNNPDSKNNWAGVPISQRAAEAGVEEMYKLPYADMCNASHSCYGTLEYALVGLDTSPVVHFGPMAPSTRPIQITFASMLLLITAVIESCKLSKTLTERATALNGKLRKDLTGA